jgi:Domain of unknown function (DUF4326)
MDRHERIQLKRSKGWRMPGNTAKVDRTTRWGNHPAARAGVTGREAVDIFAQWVETQATEEWKQAATLALTGKKLACWCKSGVPCHADYLLLWVLMQHGYPSSAVPGGCRTPED